MINLNTRCFILSTLFLLLVHYIASASIDERHPKLDSIMNAIEAVEDPHEKGLILHKFDISLSPLDSINKWIITEKFISLGQELNDESMVAEGYARQGVFFIMRSQLKEGAEKIIKATQILEALPARDRKENLSLGSFYNNLGIIYMRSGEESKGFEYYDKAIELFEDIDDKFSLASVLNATATLYSNIGQYSYAVEYFAESIKIYEEIESPQILNTYFNFARSYLKQSDYDNARPLLEECKKRIKDVDDEHVKSTFYQLYCGFHSSAGESEEAIIAYEEALEYHKENDLEDRLDQIHLVMTGTFLDRKEFDKVKELLDQASKNLTNQEDHMMIGKVNRNYGKYYKATGNIDKALHYYRKANDSYEIIKNYEDITSTKEVIAELLSEKGKYKEAFLIQNEVVAIKDSVDADRMKIGQQVNQMKFESDKKDLEIGNLRNAELESQVKLTKRKNQLTGSIAGLSFFGLLAFGFFRNNQKSKKVNKILSSKNKIIQEKSNQNETLLKEIHHRVKNNLQTISSLLYLQSATIIDSDAKEAIAQGQHRVESIALIHKHLYQRDNLAGIEMKDYISRLSRNLQDAYQKPEGMIKVNLDMEETELDVDTAIPLGLVINELLTNVYKYAFPDNAEGQIDITFQKFAEDNFKLKIQDNGIGKTTNSSGFGSQLVQLLSKQLEATFTEGNEYGYWSEVVSKSVRA